MRAERERKKKRFLIFENLVAFSDMDLQRKSEEMSGLRKYPLHFP